MSEIEVLPVALGQAAQAVRAFSHEVGSPLPAAELGGVLGAAWQHYASRWTDAAADLADEAAACAGVLVEDARAYLHVEAAQVRRGPR